MDELQAEDVGGRGSTQALPIALHSLARNDPDAATFALRDLSWRAKIGGGEGSRTPVPDNNPGRDYMLSRNLISAAGTPSDTLPRRLAGMKNLGPPRAVPASTHACCCVPPAQQVSAGERHGTLGRESQLLVSSFV